MGKRVRVVVLFLAVVGMVGVVVPAYCVEEAKQEQQVSDSVSGEVVSVDVDKSTVTIRQLQDASTGIYQKADVAVSPETNISKGDAVLKLSDLKAGDQVTVKYVTGTTGEKKVRVLPLKKKLSKRDNKS